MTDLIELEMCYNLQIINFANNRIQDEDNLVFLSSLPELVWLNLAGNPIRRLNKYEIFKNIYLSHIKKLED